MGAGSAGLPAAIMASMVSDLQALSSRGSAALKHSQPYRTARTRPDMTLHSASLRGNARTGSAHLGAQAARQPCGTPLLLSKRWSSTNACSSIMGIPKAMAIAARALDGLLQELYILLLGDLCAEGAFYIFRPCF